MRILFVLGAAAPFFFVTAAVVDSVGASPLWLVGAAALIGLALWWSLTAQDEPRIAARKASGRDQALRPMVRLSGSDPMDPVFGTQSVMPVSPDAGFEDAHHLVIDPNDLGGPPEDPTA